MIVLNGSLDCPSRCPAGGHGEEGGGDPWGTVASSSPPLSRARATRWWLCVSRSSARWASSTTSRCSRSSADTGRSARPSTARSRASR
ncbi:hypothetical protein NHX12_021425 [Muraenolepis orangiensis]|uniref:Uncharacterized protein n=1 Tax=Muraenolepis orangiensis TaxID=630683 RepID=A0A9Q0IV54_9TELE|nr:hypothetical protein NHX12_021425 [Muraenolepis orangiensis]